MLAPAVASASRQQRAQHALESTPLISEISGTSPAACTPPRPSVSSDCSVSFSGGLQSLHESAHRVVVLRLGGKTEAARNLANLQPAIRGRVFGDQLVQQHAKVRAQPGQTRPLRPRRRCLSAAASVAEESVAESSAESVGSAVCGFGSGTGFSDVVQRPASPAAASKSASSVGSASALPSRSARASAGPRQRGPARLRLIAQQPSSCASVTGLRDAIITASIFAFRLMKSVRRKHINPAACALRQ